MSQNGMPITLSDAQLATTYTSKNWTTSVWEFAPSSFPSLVDSFSDTTYSPLNLSVWSGPSGFNGADISDANTRLQSTYTSKGWVFPPWEYTTGQRPYLIPSLDTTYSSLNLNAWYGPSGFDGGMLTLEQARQQLTYEGDALYDLDEYTYKILFEKAGKTYLVVSNQPLRKRSATTYGRDPSGTVTIREYEMSRNYAVARPYSSSTSSTRPFGTIVAANYDFKDENGVVIANADSLPFADLKSIGTKWNFGNVWYIQEGKGFPTLHELGPAYDALMHIVTPDGMVAIALYLEDDSPVAIRYNDSTYKVGVVDLNDTDASSIRVMTPSGIKALKKISE